MRTFTEEQMELWGNTNLLVGCATLAATHTILLVLGSPPLDLIWNVILFVLMGSFGYWYYRKYQETKEKEE